MMAVANESPLTPGASSEEVGRGWFGWVLFMYADRPRKKNNFLFKANYLFIFIHYIYCPQNNGITPSPMVHTARTSFPFPPPVLSV